MSSDNGEPSSLTDAVLAASSAYPAARKVLLDEITRDVPDGPLAHYTTQAGAYGILQDGTLWASDPRHLNDKHETRQVGHVWREAFSQLAEEWREQVLWPSPEERMALLGALEHQVFDNLRDGTIFQPNQHVYVTCFTRNADQLSQWRGYGGEAGPAYSLAFSPDDLRRLLPARTRSKPSEPKDHWRTRLDQDADVRLLKVQYGKQAQLDPALRALRTYADDLVSALLDMSPPRQSAQLADAAGYVVDLMQLQALSLKDKGFDEEAEWRLVVTQDVAADGPLFRPSGLGLIPYKRLALPTTVDGDERGRLPELAYVTQGPHVSGSLALSSMHRLFDAWKYDEVAYVDEKVSESLIPYRQM